MMVDDQGVISAYDDAPVEEEEAEGEEPKAEEEAEEVEASEECKDCEGDVDLKEPCWEGYEQYGTKMVDGKEVPNCVPIDAEKEKEVEMSDEVVSEVAEATAEAKDPKKVVESTTTSKETYFAEQEKLKVEFASAKEQWATERAELETIKTELSAEIDELKERLATEPSAEPLSHSVEGKGEDVRLYKHKSKHRTNTKDSVLSRLYK
jgi:hypothetical protein